MLYLIELRPFNIDPEPLPQAFQRTVVGGTAQVVNLEPPRRKAELHGFAIHWRVVYLLDLRAAAIASPDPHMFDAKHVLIILAESEGVEPSWRVGLVRGFPLRGGKTSAQAGCFSASVLVTDCPPWASSPRRKERESNPHGACTPSAFQADALPLSDPSMFTLDTGGGDRSRTCMLRVGLRLVPPFQEASAQAESFCNDGFSDRCLYQLGYFPIL